MTVEITIQVPDRLRGPLEQVSDRLPEVLERGLREVLAEDAVVAEDERAIIAVLTSQPTPEQVLALRPSMELQAHVTELLERSKQGQLTASEAVDLERYLLLEHLVRVAKTQAYHRLSSNM